MSSAFDPAWDCTDVKEQHWLSLAGQDLCYRGKGKESKEKEGLREG